MIQNFNSSNWANQVSACQYSKLVPAEFKQNLLNAGVQSEKKSNYTVTIDRLFMKDIKKYIYNPISFVRYFFRKIPCEWEFK